MNAKSLFNCADVRGVKSADMRATTVQSIPRTKGKSH